MPWEVVLELNMQIIFMLRLDLKSEFIKIVKAEMQNTCRRFDVKKCVACELAAISSG